MNQLDRDFAQFARTGEPAALGRVYDAAAAELLALATRLVGDPIEAEDLVQATFVAAIESSARVAPGRSVMPWLVGILNNRVRRFWRSRERTAAVTRSRARRMRGSALATPAVPAGDEDELAAADPTPAQQVEQRELNATVALAIAGMSATLQPVVILHLRHGMQPAEIAYALARPPATVRSQLARGLEDLRRRLPRRHLLPALLLVQIPRGLMAVRTAVLAHGTTHAATAATTIGGVLVMTKQLKALVAAFVVMALGAGAYWLPRSDAQPGRDDATTLPIAAAQSDARPAAPPADEANAAEARTIPATARKQVSNNDSSTVRVTVRTSARPLASAIVELLPTDAPDDRARTQRMATDADGVAQFEDVPYTSGHVFVKNTQTMEEWDAERGETAAVELIVPEPGWVHGRVLAPTGMPAPEAIVWLIDPPYGDNGVIDVLRTPSDGTFALPVWNWHLVGARAPGTIPTQREVKVAPGESLDIVLQLRTGGAGLSGRVVRGQPARPVAGAVLELGDRLWPFEGRLLPDGSRESVVPFTAVTDHEGHFLFDGVSPGATSVHAVATGSAPLRQAVDLHQGAMTTVTLTLEHGVRVHGRVARADGKPALGARVQGGDGFAAQHARVDRSGHYELRHLPTGWVRLTAQHGQDTAKESRRLAEGEDLEWNPVLDTRWSQITGTVRDQHGQPLANWWVVAHTDSPYDAGMAQRTAHDGAFRFEQLLPAPAVYDLHVHPPCEASGAMQTPTLPSALERPAVAVGARDVPLLVPDAAIPTAWVRGRVADNGSQRLPLFLVAEHGSRRFLERDGDGSFICGPLAKGRWRIVQRFPHDGEVCAFELQAHESRDLGTLTTKAIEFGSVEITLNAPASPPEFAAEFDGIAAVQLLCAETMQFVRWVELHGEHTNLRLLPGRYLLRLCGAPLWAPPEPCEVIASRASRVTFAAKPAAMRRIAFRHPGSAHPLEPAELVVRDEAGSLVWSQTMPPVEKGWHAELNLLPGTYRVVASTASGLRCEQPLRIEAATLAARPIVFDLEP